MKDLTLRHWRSFEAAAAFGSFSRAAEALEVTQPAISMQIKQLEDAVGLALFDKQARPMALTPAGQVMLRHARAILAEVRMAEDAVLSLAAGLQGVLHLGVVAPAHYFVPALLQAFHRRHPQLKVQVAVDKRDHLLTQLAEVRLDLAITGYPPAEAEVQADVFARHPHCIIAPPEHPLAASRDIPWSQLRGETFVMREVGSATRAFLEHLLQMQRMQVRADIELQGPEAVKAAVMAGMGISFASAHTFQSELAAGRLVVLDVQGMPKQLDWCVLSRRDTPLTATQQQLREHILQQGAQAAACDPG